MTITDCLINGNERELSAIIAGKVPESGELSPTHKELLYRVKKFNEAEFLFDRKAIRYKDGFEYSEEYTLVNGLRVPTGFVVNHAGVFTTKGVKILEGIPVTKLVIDGGRYPSYYRIKRLKEENAYTVCVKDLTKKNEVEVETFLAEYCYYNNVAEMRF